MSLLYRLADKPVIAALRDSRNMSDVLERGADICFVMGGTINGLREAVSRAKAAGVGAFVHVDLIKGLSRSDKEAVEFIAAGTGADGIVTPKANLVHEAQRLGILAVLHLFIIDSLALQNGLRLIESVKPDAVEIMPGVIPKTIGLFAEACGPIPVIASGLIESKAEVEACLLAGAAGVSTSSGGLWGLTYSELADGPSDPQSIL